MIDFDPELVTFDYVRLKSITQALGGSLQYIDEEKTIDKKEAYIRIPVPLAVARAFIQRHQKVTKYLKPVWTCIVRYGTHIVALERHPMGVMGELEMEGLHGDMIHWNPYAQQNYMKLVEPLIINSKRTWYFDGRYAYAFDQEDHADVLNAGEIMTSDGSFRKVNAISIDFQNLADADKIQPQPRTCIAYRASADAYAISPPIWKDIGTIGRSRGGLDDDDESEAINVGPTVNFDQLDQRMAVNLNFALRAGIEVGKMFGYEHIEPLQLSRLMIELHTVNLPNISKQIKATYNIGLSFTHAMAWLLGLTRKANTLETHIMMRSLLKYLTKKGIFRSNSFENTQVFLDGFTVNSVPLLKLDDLMEEDGFTAAAEHLLFDKKQKKRTTSGDINVIAGLLND